MYGFLALLISNLQKVHSFLFPALSDGQPPSPYFGIALPYSRTPPSLPRWPVFPQLCWDFIY